MQLKKWILPILLPVQILFIYWIKRYPEWVEANYSQGIYPKISYLLRSIFGKFDFSIGDILYIILVINILAFVFKKVKKRLVPWQEIVRKTLALASVVYFAFHFLWGMNYYRLPLHKVLKIENDYTTEQLEKITYQLIEKSNNLHKKLQANDSLAVVDPYSRSEILDMTIDAYKNLEKVFPKLKYHPKSIKKSMLSVPLTYMGFSGYLNPFTNEAQVNRLVIPYKMHTTSCHEEAHQLGFAKENEANFIGVMACINSPDPYFNYSGYTFGLKHCLNELFRRDTQKFLCAKEKMRYGILMNYQESKDFWLKYDNPAEPYFKGFYSEFLKVNNQAEGMRSYSYVVALLVNYFDR